MSPELTPELSYHLKNPTIPNGMSLYIIHSIQAENKVICTCLLLISKQVAKHFVTAGMSLKSAVRKIGPDKLSVSQAGQGPGCLKDSLSLDESAHPLCSTLCVPLMKPGEFYPISDPLSF